MNIASNPSPSEQRSRRAINGNGRGDEKGDDEKGDDWGREAQLPIRRQGSPAVAPRNRSI
jgi:hypothetical protein